MKAQDDSKGWPQGWLIAAAAAVLSAVLARMVGELGMFAALMIAIFVFLVFGVLLGLFWGGPAVLPQDAPHGHAPEAKAQDGNAGMHAPGGAASHRQPPVAAVGHGIAEEVAAQAIAVEEAAPPPAADQPVLAAPEAVATDDGMAQAPVAQALMAAPGLQTAPAEQGIAEEVAAQAIAVEDAAPPPAADQPVLAAPEAVATDDGMAQAPVAQALLAEDDTAARQSGAEQHEADSIAPRRSKEERAAARAAKAARQAAKAARSEPPPPIPDPVPEGGRRPQGLAAARGGAPDNLQTIEGIGPVLEKLCHELGIYHFDQIAGWREAEIAWMDGNLKGFKGRVTRDKWVRQAALIGEVGVDEFLRRAKSNDY